MKIDLVEAVRVEIVDWPVADIAVWIKRLWTLHFRISGINTQKSPQDSCQVSGPEVLQLRLRVELLLRVLIGLLDRHRRAGGPVAEPRVAERVGRRLVDELAVRVRDRVGRTEM